MPAGNLTASAPIAWRRAAIVVVLVCLAAGVLTALHATDLSGGGAARFMPACLFHETTGLHCPICGATRATQAMLYGDLSAALNNNALYVLIGLPAAAAWVVWAGWPWLCGRPMPRLRSWMIRTAAVLFFGFWVLRNVPVEPLTWLAPVD